jgi:hypothetical protein
MSYFGYGITVLLIAATSSLRMAVADVEWGSVSGKVTDSELNPVANATVRLVRDGNVIQAARTDESGEFTIEQIPPGRHRISADKSGYKPAKSIPVVVKTGSTAWYNPTIESLTPVKAETYE